ncbi:lipase family protein [Paenibacillus guangzhouensis]|uniref:lipase family protein n=1 Tax=Paenibacillus guangzhouensis TaxID=1473112 RepID=UPI001267649F|nr:lipase family protein [Paenibacillus guangzhouensis]
MSANGYQVRMAIFLAAVCEQTYDQYSDPDGRFVVPYGYQSTAEISAKSFRGEWERFGFVLESESDIILAFRGTVSTSDWISDAIAMQTPFKFVNNAGLTHKGFTDIYSSARPQIMELLSKAPADKTVYITGHSLGGALATLCAIDVAANTAYTTPWVYTFGSPRVGDPAFSKAFIRQVKTSYRINNLVDAVTHIPPFIYKLPKRKKTVFYTHVRHSVSMLFQNGSPGNNHIIGSYYEALAKEDPLYARQLCMLNPGFCPD